MWGRTLTAREADHLSVVICQMQTATSRARSNSNPSIEVIPLFSNSEYSNSLRTPAEKAYATVNNYHFSRHACRLSLSLYDNPADFDIIPNTNFLLVKSLPPSTTAGHLFELFRRFGPLYRVELGTAGQASIRYYEESDLQRALEEMHMSKAGGKAVSVRLDDGGARGGRGLGSGAEASAEFSSTITPGPTSTVMSSAPSTGNASQTSAHSGWTASTSSPKSFPTNSPASTPNSSPVISRNVVEKSHEVDASMERLVLTGEDAEQSVNVSR